MFKPGPTKPEKAPHRGGPPVYWPHVQGMAHPVEFLAERLPGVWHVVEWRRLLGLCAAFSTFATALHPVRTPLT